MQQLSAEQKKQIEALAESLTDVKIAKKLHLDKLKVQAHLDTVKQERRSRRERTFKLIMISLPLLFFILLEISLRILNYGGATSLFIPADTTPGFLKVNDNVGRRYFSATEITPETSHDIFRVVKSPNAYRIFVMGESTTAGYPYMYNGSMSKMLYQRLLDYFPDREIEVVNLAMPATNSFSVRDLAFEALEQRPDALIIYCGHNEFYGALGAGSTESLGRWRWVINQYLRLQRFKTMLFLRDQLEAAKRLLGSSRKSDGAVTTTLMEQMAADQHIAYQSDTYTRAREFFKANLLDVISAARDKGVRVMLCNLVSNIHDQAPFVSLYATNTDHSKYEAALKRGATLAANGNYAEALVIYDSLEALDSSPASLHFQKGRALEGMQNFYEAHLAYERARDYDGLRFRASADFNKAIQDVVQIGGVAFVDMEAAFAAESPNSLIGKNLMFEHVHPTLEGYFIMGRELCQTMRQGGFVANIWDDTRSKPDSIYWQQRGVTELDDEIAHIRIAVLTNSWPFVPKEQAAPFVYQPRNLLEKLAYSTWRREDTWETAHVKLAEDYEKRGLLSLAAKEYEALALLTPYNASPYVRAGLIYAAMNDYDRAYDRMICSLALEQTTEANKVIGAILVTRGQPEAAVPYLEKALQFVPTDAQTLYNLTGAYMLLGEKEKAEAALTQLEKLMPGNARVEQLKRGLPNIVNAKQNSSANGS